MKRIRIVAALMTCAVLAGCVTTEIERFSYNHETGEVIREWIDLRSKKGFDDEDYSIDNDWNSLKEILTAEKPDYPTGVVEQGERELFEDEGVLSGRKTYTVRCPECFPHAVDVLKYLLKEEDDYRFEEINGETVLFLPRKREVVNSNGQVVQSKGNCIIIWPADTVHFEFSIKGQYPGGTSLLPYFRADAELNPAE